MNDNPLREETKEAHLSLIKEICGKIGQAIEDIEEICDEEEIPKIQITPNSMYQGIGLYFYVQEQERIIKEKYPAFNDNEVLNIVVATWEKLSKQQKMAYIEQIKPEKVSKSKKLKKISKQLEKTVKSSKENCELEDREIKHMKEQAHMIENKEASDLQKCENEKKFLEISNKQVVQTEKFQEQQVPQQVLPPEEIQISKKETDISQKQSEKDVVSEAKLPDTTSHNDIAEVEYVNCEKVLPISDIPSATAMPNNIESQPTNLHYSEDKIICQQLQPENNSQIIKKVDIISSEMNQVQANNIEIPKNEEQQEKPSERQKIVTEEEKEVCVEVHSNERHLPVNLVPETAEEILQYPEQKTE